MHNHVINVKLFFGSVTTMSNRRESTDFSKSKLTRYSRWSRCHLLPEFLVHFRTNEGWYPLVIYIIDKSRSVEIVNRWTAEDSHPWHLSEKRPTLLSSDECGPHGIRREYICSHPSWYGSHRPQRGTVVTVRKCLLSQLPACLLPWIPSSPLKLWRLGKMK